jgi:hypothetical protein
MDTPVPELAGDGSASDREALLRAVSHRVKTMTGAG